MFYGVLRRALEQIEDALQIALLVPVIFRSARAALSVMRDDLTRLIEGLDAAGAVRQELLRVLVD
jgi:hypothetical protein